MTAIEETKNLETLLLDELVGFLFTHKIRIEEGVEDQKIEKKKANDVTWSDEDSSDDEEHEVANFCVMAIDESK
ncbi:hypothetical protein J1N35_004742, partial [Gossypium stocksii]